MVRQGAGTGQWQIILLVWTLKLNFALKFYCAVSVRGMGRNTSQSVISSFVPSSELSGTWNSTKYMAYLFPLAQMLPQTAPGHTARGRRPAAYGDPRAACNITIFGGFGLKLFSFHSRRFWGLVGDTLWSVLGRYAQLGQTPILMQVWVNSSF